MFSVCWFLLFWAYWSLISSRCKLIDEERFQRHAEIAKLIKVISNYDKDHRIAQPRFERKKLAIPQGESAISTPIEGVESPEMSNMSIASSDYGFKVENLSKKQKKALRKTEKIAMQVRSDPDNVTKEEVDHVCEAIHLRAYGGKSASFADANGKSTEDDENFPYGEGISPDLVAENIHFSSHQRNKFYGRGGMPKVAGSPLTDETPTKTTNAPTLASSSKIPSAYKHSVGQDLLAGVDIMIFERLGVPVTLGHDQSKKRKDMVKQLARLITVDIDIIKKQYEDIRTREAGFWRFVGSAILDNMVELHKGFSWATGELKNKKKYGDGLRVTGINLMPDGPVEVPDVVDFEGAQFEDEEREDITMADDTENEPPIVLDGSVLQEIKDEKRQKRLSAKAWTAKSKSRSKVMNPKSSPPRAINVLRIIETTRADLNSSPSKDESNLAFSTVTKSNKTAKSFNSRRMTLAFGNPNKALVKAPAKSQQKKFGTTGFFDSLDDMEA